MLNPGHEAQRYAHEYSPPISPSQKSRDIQLSTLNTPVSPPLGPSKARKPVDSQPIPINPSTSTANVDPNPPSLAAIEAGQEQVSDHLSIFSSRLGQAVRSTDASTPQTSIPEWVDLYRSNQHTEGRHFVIHQHDHPIAGPHYDLRLQFSDSSSVSWSIMYGMPGDPNSRRINRNATETRVHCLWNHLVETASAKTGSMIIWDTGQYEILPYYEELSGPETDDSRSNVSSDLSVIGDQISDSEKLHQAFQNRKIRLRLHGTRLPPGYTIILRLAKSMDTRQSTHTPKKRRRRKLSAKARDARPPSTSSSGSPSERGGSGTPAPRHSDQKQDTNSSVSPSLLAHSDSEDDLDHQIRLNNAYPGSTNSIGSIHQRRWFITLDRVNSGFQDELNPHTGRKQWVRRQDANTGRLLGFDPFYVRGPEVERSVVTARLGKDVLEDEDVTGFVGRRGWRAVLE
ncbi:uncharacterized protein LDX57_006300 [Aspergillus melleus]|uniref:uncharacterized protein n=1 Tax=Aspergillus melleus TaxID=138277 RepID=UPI001E8E7CA1|nr:uncharacterized protein LDX57_006300 [Aspergillus melleus]KAH8428604.1 hypothetical protein LDX57_006300 [Aspergillus melleus]